MGDGNARLSVGAPPSPIRILVVEDSHYTRSGIVALVNATPDMRVIGAASNGPEALAQCQRLRPDLCVVDLVLPGMSGVEFITHLRAVDPNLRVLVLTAFQHDENIAQAMRAGAAGYLTKAAEGEELLAALRAVAAGKGYIPAEIAARLSVIEKQADLTNRELDVLKLLCLGRSNRDIAKALAITEKTAGFYVSNILAKLPAKTRSEAVGIAHQRGLVSFASVNPSGNGNDREGS